eukprot:scaffold42680_cov206-Amphora_coffeaeformis.AAC.1
MIHHHKATTTTTTKMVGTSVADYSSVEELRKRLERGQLYGHDSGDTNPQDLDNNNSSSSDLQDPCAQQQQHQVHVDYLDWYIPEADPTRSRSQSVEQETQRLLVLQSYQLVRLLEQQERAYDLDRLSTMARQVFGVKISFISIIDLGRCLFLALDGLDIRQVPRRQTFCSHAVISSQDFYEVRDAQQDAIFCQYPM